ncbi:MAG: hypothetical protein WD572_09925 [Gammaproteobacteria bacterium]
MSAYAGYFLGAGFASCMLWWPICFIAARGSFKFKYKWYFFLIGYFLASIISAAFILLIEIGVSEKYQSIANEFGAPIAASLIVILSFSLVIKSQINESGEKQATENETHK